ncbi:MAG: thioredoxin, partial [Propionibacteriaceae bacterium]|nr:thioredoxin [Propionibacteriaceae bacterium]
MAAVAEVTDATFAEQVLKSSKPVLVDYWAEWCAPCKQLSPIIEELAGEYGDQISFYKLNADENTQTTISYGILGLPTIQVFVGGEVVKQFQGGK